MRINAKAFAVVMLWISFESLFSFEPNNEAIMASLLLGAIFFDFLGKSNRQEFWQHNSNREVNRMIIISRQL